MSIGVIRRLAARKLRSMRYRGFGRRGDTEYLLSSLPNARRLLTAVEDARAGRGTRVTTTDELRRELGL